MAISATTSLIQLERHAVSDPPMPPVQSIADAQPPQGRSRCAQSSSRLVDDHVVASASVDVFGHERLTSDRYELHA